MSDGYESALFSVRAKGGKVKQLTPWGEIDENPTWSPDSRRIIFAVGPHGSIETIRPDGSERHTIRPATETFGGHKPWFSPDGSRILLMCENQGLLPDPPPDYNEDLCVMDADGSDLVNITNTPEIFENWPSWAPAPSDDDDDERDDD